MDTWRISFIFLLPSCIWMKVQKLRRFAWKPSFGTNGNQRGNKESYLFYVYALCLRSSKTRPDGTYNPLFEKLPFANRMFQNVIAWKPSFGTIRILKGHKESFTFMFHMLCILDPAKPGLMHLYNPCVVQSLIPKKLMNTLYSCVSAIFKIIQFAKLGSSSI